MHNSSYFLSISTKERIEDRLKQAEMFRLAELGKPKTKSDTLGRFLSIKSRAILTAVTTFF